MAAVLTKCAARHIESMLQRRGHGVGLRLDTNVSGCSVFSHVVDYADAAGNDDILFESHGVNDVVNSQNMQQVDGLEVGYLSTNALNQGFEFRNPNVKEACGCGGSFSVQ